MPARKTLPQSTVDVVLIEAGYRCANPQCGYPLLHQHHLDPVSNSGSDKPENLLALCPNCHDQYHRRYIKTEALHTWKQRLVAMNHALGRDQMDLLLFLRRGAGKWDLACYTLDGLSRFAGLIVAGLVEAEMNPLTPNAVKLASVPSLIDRYKEAMGAHERIQARTIDVSAKIDEMLDQSSLTPDLHGDQEDAKEENGPQALARARDEMQKAAEETGTALARIERSIGKEVADIDAGNVDYRQVLFSLKLTQKGEMLADEWLDNRPQGEERNVEGGD